MIGDLHCHTRLSDGSMGIEEVVMYAKRMGMDFLSITDHDTLAGVKRADVLCKRYGISLIPGVEISCMDKARNRKVHVLCYLPEKPARIEGICSMITSSRAKAGTQMVKNVMKYYPLTIENVLKYSQGSLCIYTQHIMSALMDAGYADRIYCDLYYELFDEKSGSIRVPVEYPEVMAAINLMRSAGAIVVLAHPGTYHSLDLAEELAEQGKIDGIELFHPRNTPEEMDQIKELAQRYHLITTGGTDFHGMYSSIPNPIGSYITTDDQIDALYRLKAQRKND